jgi:hypothetical protein
MGSQEREREKERSGKYQVEFDLKLFVAATIADQNVEGKEH